MVCTFKDKVVNPVWYCGISSAVHCQYVWWWVWLSITAEMQCTSCSISLIMLTPLHVKHPEGLFIDMEPSTQPTQGGICEQHCEGKTGKQPTGKVLTQTSQQSRIIRVDELLCLSHKQKKSTAFEQCSLLWLWEVQTRTSQK